MIYASYSWTNGKLIIDSISIAPKSNCNGLAIYRINKDLIPPMKKHKLRVICTHPQSTR